MRVAVIGGGVMGAATSWRLAKRGVDVICFDRLSPPHAFGSSHGESRIIRSAYFEGSHYVPLLQEVFPMWRELETLSGLRLLTMTGALYIGNPSAEAIVGAQASAKAHGLDVELLDTAAMRQRYPGHLRVERQVHAWFSIARDADWFAPDRFPVFIRQSEQFGDVYGFPTLDGDSVKVGRHHAGDFTDPDHIRRRVDEIDVDPLRLMAATFMRGVSGHVTRTLTCMYSNTPDHDFVIDFSPNDNRVVVLSPCSGHGFKFAPVIGDIAADLVCDGKTKRDISRFSATRFAPSSHVPDDKANRD